MRPIAAAGLLRYGATTSLGLRTEHTATDVGINVFLASACQL
jgi:hypothetical protein